MDLTEHPLLAGLTAVERSAVVELVDEVVLEPGAKLAQQDGPPAGLHLVLDGHVEVTVHHDEDDHDVAVLGPGSSVGELSLLRPGPASATVTALDEVRAGRIAPSAAARLLEVDAVALQLDALARRRRATNRALSVAPVEAGTVADGTPLQLRPLWPEDWRQLATGTERVSERSLRMRFFGMPPLTERTFRRLTATDHADQFAWGAFTDGMLVGVGRHALQVEDRSVAEVAFLVADDLHGQGVGARLTTAVIGAVAAHGADHLTALARADNGAIQSLLTRTGAVWQHDYAGSVEATWPVAEALRNVTDQDLLESARRTAAIVLGDVTDP